MWTYKTEGQVNDVKVSPDGGFVVAGSSDGKVNVLNSEGEFLWKTVILANVNSVSVARGGTYVAAGADDSYARLYGSDKAEILKYTTFGYVKGVSLSANGLDMAVASNDGHVYFLRLPVSVAPLVPVPTVTGIPPTEHAGSSGGTISVSSAPSGASVYLDNNYIGNSPVLKSGISAGSHTILVRIAGYNDWNSEVIISGEQTFQVTASLIPSTTETTPLSSVVAVLGIILASVVFLMRVKENR